MEDAITIAIRKLVQEELEVAQAQFQQRPPRLPATPVECRCPCRSASTTDLDTTAAFWSTAQAAAFLGLKPKTVLNMCSLGEIPYEKNGRLNAYSPADIVAIQRQRFSG